MTSRLPSSSSEFHLCEGERSPEDVDRDVEVWRPYLGSKILDIGCGEGHLVAALARAGYAAEGVDATPDLVARARARGVTVTQGDALDFIRTDGSRFDTFLMIDFVEHIPFDQTAAILQALPVGANCIIQTPNTNSIIGHQFYLQVPGHVTPLSAAVLEKMVARAGLAVKATGTRWGGLPWTGLRRRVTLFVLEKVFGRVLLPLFVQGANYYIVAEKSASRS